jgi:DNA-binding response OmpR family regulator
MGRKILVVDDEEDIRSTVKTILEAEGYKVTIAVNGDDCLKKLKLNKFDLILMDIMMPGTPTKDVVKKITDTKIAFLSVVRASEAEREALLKQKNIVDYIQKPFDIQLLISKVHELTK